MLLTIIDTAGIQDYIFRSNKLRHIVGASYLVNCATRDWVKEAFESCEIKHNILNLDGNKKEEIISDLRIEDGNIDAELIYAGGGNTLILFSDQKYAEKFTRELTSRVLLEAPGLQLVISHKQFDWNKTKLGGSEGVLNQAFASIAKRKSEYQPSLLESGFGVTAECVFTSLPAVDVDKGGRLISSEIQAKLEAELKGHKRLIEMISFGQYLDPPHELDELGRSEGEKSLLAVVHTDGNSMGNRILAIQLTENGVKENRECIYDLRDFSISIQTGAMNALQATVDHLISSTSQDGFTIAGEIEISHERLPFRPIVFGGDDLTFICDGRLGLDLASFYLKTAAMQELSDGKKLYCRAGVAIVKTHYPFSRAYELAEELCASAKANIKEIKDEITYSLETQNIEADFDFQMASLDWHFSLTGILDNLKNIRVREYTNDIGKLTMRPLMVCKEIVVKGGGNCPSIKSNWRNWDAFTEIVDTFRTGDKWVGHHNKVKSLRQTLRDGKDAVNRFCINYMTTLPKVQGQDSDNGWIGEHCAYFDAIEAIDTIILL